MSINSHIQTRFGLICETGKTVHGNTTLNNILSRRSYRSYTDEAVSKDMLETLFSAAFSAPSKSDLQQSCVIHIKDKAKQQRIASISPSIRWLAEAPVFLVWCGDNRRIRKLADLRGHKFDNDHLDSFMNAAVDAGICMQTFIIAAESLGLACCPVSEIRNNINLLSNELELPHHVFPVAGLCVGWPRQKEDVSMRLPLTITVKEDIYNDDSLFDEISDYDIRREAVEKTPPEQQRYVEEFGVSSNYGWSENHTRQYSKPSRDDFGSYIRKQGFNLA